ncbi:MAG: mandelate racemase/muconate lactonizing enzyme family protein [Hyphomicrobiales bacterium]|nr:mandelate racemase/muconate lactonizing enzyme family protein [Hyphomicrobiales bacterium]
MKVTRVSAVVYSQDLTLTGPPPKFAGEARSAFQSLLVKVETDEGIVGWGEAFAHRVVANVKSALETLIAPHCIGADPTNISNLMESLIRRTYGIGRTGPVMYALSGLDIALWDILGKAAGLPVCKLLGGARCATVPAYASLLRYGDREVVVRYSEEALARGYQQLKIHEIGLSEIAAAQAIQRRHNGEGLMVDVNAPWTLQEALARAPRLRELQLTWLEEPIWPPEDFRALDELRRTGIPVSIGETVATPTDFARLIECRAADYIQPSVTKIGGISAMRDIYTLANHASVAVVPHSAYFGPGLVATAHVIAAFSRMPMIERLYCDLAVDPFGNWNVPVNGAVTVPTGPGLGVEPDEKVLERCRVA